MICKYILLIMFLNKPKFILLHTVKWFQVLPFITNNSIEHQSFVYIQLNDQTVLSQIIQFSISHLLALSQTVLFDRNLSGAPTLGQSGLESNVTERVPHISQNASITGASSSDCFVSHPGQSLEESYPSAEMQSVYSTAAAN